MVGTGNISLNEVATEIYGNSTPPKNLNQCFIDATGTFNNTYQPNSDGSKNNLINFKGYEHTLSLVYDYDGNPYQPIKIGNQIWLDRNFQCTHLNNGVIIPRKDSIFINDGSLSNSSDFYNTSLAYTQVWAYGVGYQGSFYYNAGAAFMLTSSLFPIPGWHVPTLNDLNILASNLGGSNVAGGKMKVTGTTYWNSPNTGADNSSGFSGKPDGLINNLIWNYKGQKMYFWLSDDPVSGVYKSGLLSYNLSSLNSADALAPYGFPVRLIKD